MLDRLNSVSEPTRYCEVVLTSSGRDDRNSPGRFASVAWLCGFLAFFAFRKLSESQTFLDTGPAFQLYPHKFMSEAADNSSPKLVRGLGLMDASMIVVGSMI